MTFLHSYWLHHLSGTDEFLRTAAEDIDDDDEVRHGQHHWALYSRPVYSLGRGHVFRPTVWLVVIPEVLQRFGGMSLPE